MAMIYFLAITIIFGMIARKKTRSAKDFLKSGQGFGWIMMAFAFSLLPLGAGNTLSLWESAPVLGASVLWWAIVAGGLFIPVMMMFLGPIVRQSGCNNMPEILEHVIDVKFGRLNAGINIACWTGIGSAETLATAAAVYGLGGHRLEGVLPGSAFVWCTLIALCLVVLYVIFGGILQMAMLNMVNAVVMIVCSYVAVGMLGVWLAANIGGWSGVQAIFDEMGQSHMLTAFDFGNSALWLQVIIPVVVLHMTACGISQMMNQPFFAARSDEECRKGVFLAPFWNVMSSVPWIILALTAFGISQSAKFQNLLPNLIDNPDAAKLGPIELALEALPAPIIGLLMISLLCATLSTGGPMAMGNANILVNEIFKKGFNPDMSEETRFKLIRISIIICAAFFAVPALLNAVIFPVFLWCFSFGIPVFVIYIMGLKVRRNTTAAWITIIAAYAVNFWWTFAPPHMIPGADLLGGAFSLNMYPVTIVSIVLGVILPFVIPGGKPAFLKGKGFEGSADRLAG
ncbi:MAG: hypothetical protein FWH32_00940 [Clostridiales bacterium]|nr:hypothetical protein [Clostridiales bacterium]